MPIDLTVSPGAGSDRTAPVNGGFIDLTAAPSRRSAADVYARHLYAGKTLEQTNKTLAEEGHAPLAGPAAQDYKLGLARQKNAELAASGEKQVGTFEAFAQYYQPFRNFIRLTPFDGRTVTAGEYHASQQAFAAGKATDDDIGRIADYERTLAAFEEVEKAGTLGKSVTAFGHVGQIGAEMAAAGGVAGRLVPARTAAQVAFGGRLAAFPARAALITAGSPAMYVPAAQAINEREGRRPGDWRGYPTAVAHGYLMTMALGHMQGLAGNSLKKGAIGAAEIQGLEEATAFSDALMSKSEFLKKYRVGSHGGILSAGMTGERKKIDEAAETLVAQWLSFSALAYAHSKSDALSDRIDRSRARYADAVESKKAGVAPEYEVVEAAKEMDADLRAKGLDEAGVRDLFFEANAAVGQMLRDPYITPAEAKRAFSYMDPVVRRYAEKLVERLVPERQWGRSHDEMTASLAEHTKGATRETPPRVPTAEAVPETPGELLPDAEFVDDVPMGTAAGPTPGTGTVPAGVPKVGDPGHVPVPERQPLPGNLPLEAPPQKPAEPAKAPGTPPEGRGKKTPPTPPEAPNAPQAKAPEAGGAFTPEALDAAAAKGAKPTKAPPAAPTPDQLAREYVAAARTAGRVGADGRLTEDVGAVVAYAEKALGRELTVPETEAAVAAWEAAEADLARPVDVRLAEAIAKSPGLSPENQKFFAESTARVLKDLTPVERQRLSEGLVDATYYNTPLEAGVACVEHALALAERHNPRKAPRLRKELAEIKSGKKKVGGGVTPDGRMFVDGEFLGVAAKEVQAHEIGHLVDGTGNRQYELSGTPGWKKAWAELKKNGTGTGWDYSKENAHEGFAEFYSYVRGADGALFEKGARFPLAREFFRSKGIWPAETSPVGTGRAPAKTELFDAEASVTDPAVGSVDVLKEKAADPATVAAPARHGPSTLVHGRRVVDPKTLGVLAGERAARKRAEADDSPEGFRKLRELEDMLAGQANTSRAAVARLEGKLGRDRERYAKQVDLTGDRSPEARGAKDLVKRTEGMLAQAAATLSAHEGQLATVAGRIAAVGERRRGGKSVTADEVIDDPRAVLESALGQIDKVQADIVRARLGSDTEVPKTLDEIGKAYKKKDGTVGATRAYMSLLEKQAIKNIKAALQRANPGGLPKELLDADTIERLYEAVAEVQTRRGTKTGAYVGEDGGAKGAEVEQRIREVADEGGGRRPREVVDDVADAEGDPGYSAMGVRRQPLPAEAERREVEALRIRMQSEAAMLLMRRQAESLDLTYITPEEQQAALSAEMADVAEAFEDPSHPWSKLDSAGLRELIADTQDTLERHARDGQMAVSTENLLPGGEILDPELRRRVAEQQEGEAFTEKGARFVPWESVLSERGRAVTENPAVVSGLVIHVKAALQDRGYNVIANSDHYRYDRPHGLPYEAKPDWWGKFGERNSWQGGREFGLDPVVARLAERAMNLIADGRSLPDAALAVVADAFPDISRTHPTVEGINAAKAEWMRANGLDGRQPLPEPWAADFPGYSAMGVRKKGGGKTPAAVAAPVSEVRRKAAELQELDESFQEFQDLLARRNSLETDEAEAARIDERLSEIETERKADFDRLLELREWRQNVLHKGVPAEVGEFRDYLLHELVEAQNRAYVADGQRDRVKDDKTQRAVRTEAIIRLVEGDLSRLDAKGLRDAVVAARASNVPYADRGNVAFSKYPDDPGGTVKPSENVPREQRPWPSRLTPEGRELLRDERVLDTIVETVDDKLTTRSRVSFYPGEEYDPTPGAVNDHLPGQAYDAKPDWYTEEDRVHEVGRRLRAGGESRGLHPVIAGLVEEVANRLAASPASLQLPSAPGSTEAASRFDDLAHTEKLERLAHDLARDVVGEHFRWANDVKESHSDIAEYLERIGLLDTSKLVEGTSDWMDTHTTFPEGLYSAMASPSLSTLATVASKAKAYVGEVLREDRPVGRFFRKWFRKSGELPDYAHRFEVERDGAINAQMAKVGDAARDYDKVIDRTRWTTAERDDANAAMRVPRAAHATDPAVRRLVARYGPEAAQVTAAFREEVDALSRLLVRVRATSGPLLTVIDRNVGSYLIRQFDIFTDRAGHLKRLDPATVAAAKSWVEADIRQNEGRTPSPAEVDRTVGELLDPGEAKRGMASILKGREEIPEILRKLWGETADPVALAAATIARQRFVIEQARYFQKLRDAGMGKHFFTPEMADEFTRQYPGTEWKEIDLTFTKEDGGRADHPLNGLKTTPGMHDALKASFETKDLPAWMKVYAGLLGATKVAKTILSHPTHFRNVGSNPGVSLRNGYTDVSLLPEAWRIVRDDTPAGREKWYKLIEQGVVGDGVDAGDVRQYAKDMIGAVGADATVAAVAKYRADRLATVAGQALKEGYERLHRLYRAEDAFFKVYGYLHEVRQWTKAKPGWTKEQVETHAASLVRDLVPTYSNTPAAVKGLRLNPFVGSFVSYPAEIVRTTYHWARITAGEIRDPDPAVRRIGYKRLMGGIGAFSAAAAVGGLTAMAVGVTADDEADIRKDLPEWDRHGPLVYTGRDKDTGKVNYVGLSRVDPHAQFGEVVRAVLAADSPEQAGQHAANVAGRPFVEEELLTRRLLDVARNKKEDGGPLYNPQAPLGGWSDPYTGGTDGRAATVAGHVAAAFLPGSVVQGQRTLNAGLGVRDERTGRQFDLGREILANVGVRESVYDPASSVSYNAVRYRKAENDATALLTQKLRAKGDVAPEDVQAAQSQMEAARQRTWEAMRASVVSAVRLGADRTEVARQLRSAGVPADEVLSLLSGVYRPKRMDPGSVRDMGPQARERMIGLATAAN